MLYDVRLDLNYAYQDWVRGDRHHIRVLPASTERMQRVVAASLTFDPRPDHRSSFTDFFGNVVTSIGYRDHHGHLDVRLTARVSVEDVTPQADLSPALAELHAELSGLWSLGPDSPHHFLGASPRVPLDPAITAYARECIADARSVQAAAVALGQAIHRDFVYDGSATEVDTPPLEAFTLRRGVCQDFAHVMIAGLRGIGVPAAYVSGFLRTVPPPGKPRLEGADAMHAWVRIWCGRHAGWIEFDPTNAMAAGPDHITIGHGRDYSDISPIIGVLRTSGTHETRQAVDVALVG